MEDHGRIARAVIGSQPSEHLITGKLRTAEVEHDELRPEREGASDRRQTVVSGLTAKIIEREPITQEIVNCAVVIDDEDDRLVWRDRQERHRAMVHPRPYDKQMTGRGE